MDIKILVVDDEEANIGLLEALLVPAGYTLIKAYNGEDAIKQLWIAEPDLILLDIIMPGMSGFEVLEAIRKNAKTAALPVILLSSLSDRADRIKGIDAGADDFISKPFDRAELLSRVRTQAGLSLLRRQINEKEKLAGVMDLMREGVAITDINFEIQQINCTGMEMLGLNGASGNLADILSEKFGQAIDRHNTAGIFIISRPETVSTGALFLSVEYLEANTGSFVFIIKDVTDEFTRNKMKGDFLSLISHKLRTPLTVISAYSKMLGVIAPVKDQTEMINAIMRNSMIMENLIKRILYFIEMDSMLKTSNLAAVDIKGTVEKAASEYKKPYELAAVKEPADMKYWKKIALEELVANAFKFSNKDKLVLSISVETEMFGVEDNGPGIPFEEREKVFEPFYQVYRNFTGNTSGAGLGLSIVKRLAELNDCSVSLVTGSLGGLKVEIRNKTHQS
jgi:signal transduction histidine kinase/DNA-binding response OmpR family regulator